MTRLALGPVCGLLFGCGEPAEPLSLSAQIEAGDVASWKLDETAWKRIVVEPYRALYVDYANAFDEAAPAIARRLAKRGAIATRKHFADDPELTTGEAWTRWALPVMYGSEVATVDGVELDAVFVPDGNRWRAITGLDRVIRARVTARDAACAARLDGAGKRCRELAWQVTDAALRSQDSRFAHACTLAANHCGKPSP